MVWTKNKPIIAKSDDKDVSINFYIKDLGDGYGNTLYASLRVDSGTFDFETIDLKVSDYTTNPQQVTLINVLRNLRNGGLELLGYTNQ
jgi:hypothetical protein